MLELTEEQIFDYIKCPLRYDARYNLGIAVKNHPSLNELLNRVANAFLLNLMNGKILSTGSLKKKWDRLCEEHRDIMTPQACLNGISLLTKMFLWAQDKQLLISDIKTPFRYSILNNDPQIMIRGELNEALVPKKDGTFELLELDFSNRYPDQAILDMKLKYTLDWKICQKQLHDKLTGIHIHHVKSGKDWFTFRSIEEFQRMDAAFKNIAACIDKKLFYPRENVLCSSCDMKLYCHAWRG